MSDVAQSDTVLILDGSGESTAAAMIVREQMPDCMIRYSDPSHDNPAPCLVTGEGSFRGYRSIRKHLIRS